MVTKKVGLLGVISAAALVSGALVGCGGSSSSTHPINPTVITSGAVTTTTGNLAPGQPPIGTSSSPQQVQVSTPSGTVNAVVPPGQPAITSSTNLVVIPSNTAFLTGVTPKFHAPTNGKKPMATAGEVFAGPTPFGPWTDLNVSIGNDLTLGESIVYPAPANNFSSEFLKLGGPLNVAGSGVNGASLDISDGFIFGFLIFADGATTLPTSIKLKLPADGGTLAGGNYANVTVSPEFFGAGSMQVVWPGVLHSQTESSASGRLGFNLHGSGNTTTDIIPAGGISSVTVSIVGFQTH